MSDLLHSMLEGWRDPHARHALLVHFPIALSFFGLGLAIALAATKFRNATLRWTCVVCLAVAAGGAYLAEQAGEASHEDIHSSLTLTDAEHEAIEAHEALGEGGWRWPAIAALLVALTALRHRKVKMAIGWLGVVAAIGVVGWVALTGHRGGRLVYVYGLGTPARGAAESSESAPPPAAQRDDHDADEGAPPDG